MRDFRFGYSTAMGFPRTELNIDVQDIQDGILRHSRTL